MPVITVASRKGGSGKTTLIANLSLLAESQSKKVLLMDLDPQKSLEFWWESRSDPTPQLIEVCDIEVCDLGINNSFDWCFIDTPGDMGSNAKRGIRLADLVLVPIKPSVLDLAAIHSTLDVIRLHKKPFVFVINQKIPKSKIEPELILILKALAPLAPEAIPGRIQFIQAMRLGLGAFELDPALKPTLQSLLQFIQQNI